MRNMLSDKEVIWNVVIKKWVLFIYTNAWVCMQKNHIYTKEKLLISIRELNSFGGHEVNINNIAIMLLATNS